MASEEKFIDIDKIIAEKNPRLSALLPGFIKRYIKKVLHQDDLNDASYRYRNRFGYDYVTAAYEEFEPVIKIHGIENIPLEGGCIIASNHPLGGLDGIVKMYVVGKVRKDIRFLVNDLLMNLKNFGEIFVPVNKLGKNSIDYMNKIEDIYASDACILIFPAGLCSRKQNGKIEDLIWKKSFINKSVKYNKPIIPCYIKARNSNWFYNLALFRKKLGIKANIEMFYLVDEMYKQRGKTIEFTFGKPIYPGTFTNEKTDSEWAELMKKHVYAIGENGNLIF